VLISGRRCLAGLVRSLNPVPTAISVSTKTPSVTQTGLISSTSTKADHHARGTTSLTESCRMVDSGRWLIAPTVKLIPTEGCTFNAETPNVVDWLSSGVSSIDEKVGLRENDSVTIATAWGRSYDWNDHPLCHVLAITHIEKVEIVRCETSAAGCTTVHDHLHLFNIGRTVCSSR